MDSSKDPDFLSDDGFIKWRLSPTEESTAWWNEFRRTHPHLEPELDSAIAKFAAIRINDRKLPKKESERLLQRILRTCARRRRRKKIMRVSAAAAVIAVAVVSAFSIRHFADTAPAVTSQTIIAQELPPQAIRLISGGSVKTFENNAEINMSETGGVSVTGLPQEVINTLIVPRGKVTTLVLSDGSKVWVNSGTEITFPSKFTGKERRITVNGEIYIEVQTDALHPFVVETSEFPIRVHGTKFNVSSYADSPAKSVALAEGKIEILIGGKSQYLNPSELFTLENGFTKVSCVEVEQYTSWKDGFLLLDKIPVAEIFTKIGRYYNVEFKQSTSALLNRTVSGKLILAGDIQEVIQVIGSIANLKYECSGDIIYIDSKE